jgi:polyphenol oxidase
MPPELSQKNGLHFYQFPNLSRFAEIKHGVFTRLSGFSKAPFQGLNVSINVGDDPESTTRNHHAILTCLDGDELVFIHQVHGSDIILLKKENTDTPLIHKNQTGEPISKLSKSITPAKVGAQKRAENTGFLFSPELQQQTFEIGSGDAIITDIPGKILMIQTADCQPILLFDPNQKVVAAVHSGWRGSLQNIIGKTIMSMVQHFHCNPEEIIAGIGPSLGPCCCEFIHYKEEIPRSFWKYQKNEYHFDFWELSQDQLRETGVRTGNVHISGLCTKCRNDLFFSYRRQKITGRFAGVIGLNRSDRR